MRERERGSQKDRGSQRERRDMQQDARPESNPSPCGVLRPPPTWFAHSPSKLPGHPPVLYLIK